ncbi:hypothetical protein PDESU_01021 [Pontiella desulfatans]|uniref:DUF4136 domain-containing protein n=1 Tax=Pontiella desulfatans TaxID=2750659 RepID=A0A6C2TXM4_PONDE|nr:hypothetical protein PDESU_01021 [Pontiella desulfatans]
MLSGCSSLKTHSWVNPEFQEHSIGKTAVLATFEDEYLAGQFEAIFAERLRNFVPAVSLRAAVTNFTELDKKQIENLLKRNQVQTLIVTHRVGSVDRTQLVPYGVSYQTYATSSGSCSTYCSSYQLDEAAASFLDNTIETSIFDVRSGKMVWSGLKEVYSFNSKASNMERVVDGIVWDLEARGMLKATMVF